MAPEASEFVPGTGEVDMLGVATRPPSVFDCPRSTYHKCRRLSVSHHRVEFRNAGHGQAADLRTTRSQSPRRRPWIAFPLPSPARRSLVGNLACWRLSRSAVQTLPRPLRASRTAPEPGCYCWQPRCCWLEAFPIRQLQVFEARCLVPEHPCHFFSRTFHHHRMPEQLAYRK